MTKQGLTGMKTAAGRGQAHNSFQLYIKHERLFYQDIKLSQLKSHKNIFGRSMMTFKDLHVHVYNMVLQNAKDTWIKTLYYLKKRDS